MGVCQQGSDVKGSREVSRCASGGGGGSATGESRQREGGVCSNSSHSSSSSSLTGRSLEDVFSSFQDTLNIHSPGIYSDTLFWNLPVRELELEERDELLQTPPSLCLDSPAASLFALTFST